MAKSIIWTLSKEEIQDKVNQCNSISDMLEAFGYQRSNGSMSKVMKKVIDTYNIDTSHFRSFKRTNQKPIYSLEEILVPNSKYENIARLKKKNFKSRPFKI